VLGEKFLHYISCLRNYAQLRCRTNHYEIIYTALGFFIGFFVGILLVGGVGIAALGTAFGISGWMLFAVVFGVVGNRIGIGCDKKALQNVKSFRAK
jgi:uncharacterized protein YcfJ